MTEGFPEKIYVWIVYQEGESRIRKWDTKPFEEATHICDGELKAAMDAADGLMRKAHADHCAAEQRIAKAYAGIQEIIEMCGNQAASIHKHGAGINETMFIGQIHGEAMDVLETLKPTAANTATEIGRIINDLG